MIICNATFVTFQWKEDIAYSSHDCARSEWQKYKFYTTTILIGMYVFMQLANNYHR